LEAIKFAKYVAHKLSNKIISLGYKFMKSEVSVPICTVGDGRLGNLRVTGRIDCILSNDDFESNRGASINIIDFKTGKYDALNSEKIASQLTEYTGLQLYMYGLVYKNLGFSDVSVQILRHDSEPADPVSIDLFLSEGGKIFAELSDILESGIIGEKEMKFHSRTAGLPLATTPLPRDILSKKRSME
jgi:hypothetical protein